MKRDRVQLNVQLSDRRYSEQLEIVAENAGMTKREIIEDLLEGLFERVRARSPELLDKHNSLSKMDRLLAYQRVHATQEEPSTV